MASGEHPEQIDTPVAGVVRDVRPGSRHRRPGRGARHPRRRERSASRRAASWRSTRNRRRAAGPGTRLRAGSLDVGLAGAILVVGSRVDAETLTRARAMGLRGIIVAGLAGKERRDFLASEARQRASLHRLPTFAVLVLDGAVRRRIAGPIASAFGGDRRPRGRDRHGPARHSCSTNPDDRARRATALISSGFEPASGPAVRVAGPGSPGCAGSPAAPSSRLAGSASTAASPVPVPLADLERFG